MNTDPTSEAVKGVLVQTLGIESRADSIGPTTALLDSLPELDSMGVVALMVALEEHFGITLEDEDMRADVFETLDSLTALVRERLGNVAG